MSVTLVLGGARSGKSEVAEGLVSGDVVYVATAEVGDDADLAARVRKHRDRRPASWTTVESGPDLAATLRSLAPDAPVLVESIGTWVARSPDLTVDVDDLVAALRGRTGSTVVVSEEVGLGVHPETEVGRVFRDVVGECNRRIAEVAGDVLLVVAGRTLRL